jgi:ABC-type amino acid transport substrate-binding protein
MKGSKLRTVILTLLLVLGTLAGVQASLATQSASGDSPRIDLTAAEAQFIAEHPTIRLGVDPGFIPYEFFDSDGVYKGIAADYIDLIEKETGLKFEVAEGLT